MSQHYQVAAYYFPQFHRDPRNDRWHGEGWTEWDLLKAATPRYPGHRQPIIPAWGYFDESDPAWAAREIDLAADHGLATFIYDWYWYDEQPFLEAALEHGFLHAPNRERLKFAVMWANHDWRNMFPAQYTNESPLLATGRVTPESFDQMTTYIIDHYFHQPNYWQVEGKPYFSIYDLGMFISSFGSVTAACEALARFERKAQAAGFAGVHVNGVVWGRPLLPGEMGLEATHEAVTRLGLSSLGTYTWVHYYEPNTDGFPRGNYAHAAREALAAEAAMRDLPLLYYPNVAVGWDPTPRTVQSNPYQARGYPWTAVLEGNTPAAFADALRQARAVADALPADQRIITINAWNEWTEGSYLLPDTVHGTAYLDAIRTVFGGGDPEASQDHQMIAAEEANA